MTTISYKSLLEQRAALEQQIEQARKAELSEAIAKARALVAEYDLTAEDVFSATKPKTARQTVAPKYRNPVTGDTWTGRGKAPRWIADQDRTQYEIK